MSKTSGLNVLALYCTAALLAACSGGSGGGGKDGPNQAEREKQIQKIVNTLGIDNSGQVEDHSVSYDPNFSLLGREVTLDHRPELLLYYQDGFGTNRGEPALRKMKPSIRHFEPAAGGDGSFHSDLKGRSEVIMGPAQGLVDVRASSQGSLLGDQSEQGVVVSITGTTMTTSVVGDVGELGNVVTPLGETIADGSIQQLFTFVSVATNDSSNKVMSFFGVQGGTEPGVYSINCGFDGRRVLSCGVPVRAVELNIQNSVNNNNPANVRFAIAKGQLDFDPGEEFVIATQQIQEGGNLVASGKLSLMDHDAKTLLKQKDLDESGSYSVALPNYGNPLSRIFVVSHPREQRRGELTLNSISYFSLDQACRVADCDLGEAVTKDKLGGNRYSNSFNNTVEDFAPLTAVADFNADSVEDLFLHSIFIDGTYLKRFLTGDAPTERTVTTLPLSGVPYTSVYHLNGGDNIIARRVTMVVGDFRGDIQLSSEGEVTRLGDRHHREIIFIARDSSGNMDLLRARPDGEGGMELLPACSYRNGFSCESEADNLVTNSVDVDDIYSDFPVLMAPDLDGDSLKAVHVSTEFGFSLPRLKAVIAAPPCFLDGRQQHGDCSTNYSQGAENAVGNGQQFQRSSTLSVGAEVGGTLFGLGAEFSAMHERTRTFGFANSTSTGWRQSREHSAGAGDNVVVLNSTPFNIYHYEISQVPPNYEEVKVGDQIPLAVAGEEVTVQTSAAEYKRLFANERSYVDITALLENSPGNPNGYATASRLRELGYSIVNSPTTPGIGRNGGVIGATFEFTESSEIEFSSSTQTTWSGELTVGPVTGGIAVSDTESTSITFSTGSFHSYGFQLGSVSGTENQYSVGLAHKVVKDEEHAQVFEVINFYRLVP